MSVRLAQHLVGDRCDHLLGQRHHLQVIGVRPVELELGELRVVRAVDALVAEVAPDLVHPLQVPHHQPLQVQLERDAQVQVLLELVVVRDEGPRRRAAVERLQDGRLHFQETALVQEAAQAPHHRRPRAEDLAHLRVDRQVGVALAEARLGVAQRGVAHDLPVLHLVLGGGQGRDRLCQHAESAHPQRRLAGAGAEHLPGCLDEISQVELPGEQVQRFLAHLVGAQEELHPPLPILDVGEGDLAHRAHRAQPPRQGDRHRR